MEPLVVKPVVLDGGLLIFWKLVSFAVPCCFIQGSKAELEARREKVRQKLEEPLIFTVFTVYIYLYITFNTYRSSNTFSQIHECLILISSTRCDLFGIWPLVFRAVPGISEGMSFPCWYSLNRDHDGPRLKKKKAEETTNSSPPVTSKGTIPSDQYCLRKQKMQHQHFRIRKDATLYILCNLNGYLRWV